MVTTYWRWHTFRETWVRRRAGSHALSVHDVASDGRIKVTCDQRLPVVRMWIIIAIGLTIQEGMMRTVQMTLDEDLVKAVDQAVKRLGTTRSAFTRNALQEALKKMRISELERKHREGYARKSVRHGEFSVWETEQVWGDE